MASAASSATMDLTQVIPQLLESVFQELGVASAKDLKLAIVAKEGDLDLKPIQQIQCYYEGMEWEFHPEPYVEIQLQADNLLMYSHTCSQSAIGCDVKGSSRCTDGTVPASEVTVHA